MKEIDVQYVSIVAGGNMKYVKNYGVSISFRDFKLSKMSFLLPFLSEDCKHRHLKILSSEPHCYAPREATVTDRVAEFPG